MLQAARPGTICTDSVAMQIYARPESWYFLFIIKYI